MYSLFYAAELSDSCFVQPLRCKGTTFFSYMQIYFNFCLAYVEKKEKSVPLHPFLRIDTHDTDFNGFTAWLADHSGPLYTDDQHHCHQLH